MYYDIGLTFIFIAWYPNFRLYILHSVKFGINIFIGCGLCQDIISTYKLQGFHEIQGLVTHFLT